METLTKAKVQQLSNAQEYKQQITDNDALIVELMDALERIDENKPSAKLNAVSIVDNKGGRIYF